SHTNPPPLPYTTLFRSVPRKEDHHLPAEALARRREAEPSGLVSAGHVGLLAHALRADDDVRQLEVDVRKGGEQLHVEACRALVQIGRATSELQSRSDLV